MSDEATPPPPTASQPADSRLREVALLFTRLGFTAFGGPAVHTALMEDEVVHRRRWLDRQHFLDLVGALNFIPGPNSTELAIHLGLIRAGYRGLVVAGFCFITPAVLVILPLAWLYVRYAGAGVAPPPPAVAGALGGIGAVVVAVLALAAWRLLGSALKNRFCVVVAVLAAASELLLRRYANVQSEIVILAAAAIAGAVWAARPKPTATLPAMAWPVGVAWLAQGSAGGDFLRLAWFFLKVGGTLFGSGYVLVNFLETGTAHEISWLTHQQLSDAVAVGQVTPGPLLTTATFIGYLRGHAVTGSDWGGVAGALIATAAIFLPAFVLVAAFGRVLPALRRKVWARGALDGMNAAVVALLVLVTCRFAGGFWTGGGVDWARVALAAAALGLMLKWNVNSTWLIVVGATIGATTIR